MTYGAACSLDGFIARFEVAAKSGDGAYPGVKNCVFWRTLQHEKVNLTWRVQYRRRRTPPLCWNTLVVRLREWLRPGGRLLLSLGGSNEPGFTSEMNGRVFYSSGYEPGASLALLGDAGFRIEHWEADDPSSRGHFVILAEAMT